MVGEGQLNVLHDESRCRRIKSQMSALDFKLLSHCPALLQSPIPYPTKCEAVATGLSMYCFLNFEKHPSAMTTSGAL